MSGTKLGGMKAAQRNKELYGNKFYQEIGRKGGRNGHSGGFASNPELARIAGAKGGSISRRGDKNPFLKKIKKNSSKIQDLYDNGMSMASIAKKLDVPQATLRKWANENVIGYGREWEEQ